MLASRARWGRTDAMDDSELCVCLLFVACGAQHLCVWLGKQSIDMDSAMIDGHTRTDMII